MKYFPIAGFEPMISRQCVGLRKVRRNGWVGPCPPPHHAPLFLLLTPKAAGRLEFQSNCLTYTPAQTGPADVVLLEDRGRQLSAADNSHELIRIISPIIRNIGNNRFCCSVTELISADRLRPLLKVSPL